VPSPPQALFAETTLYRSRIAVSADDLRALQRLRFEVFNLEFSEGLAASVATGLDADEFDAACDHLLVESRETSAVVGTYRLQTGRRAASSGHGYYCAREFDFAAYESARAEMLELGRACVAAAHRNQTVLSLLWRGIARYAQTRGARYLVGCSSLTSRSDAEGLAAYAQLAPRSLVEPRWRTQPLPEWRCRPDAKNAAHEPGASSQSPAVRIPPLMRSYLALGARICGEPAIDREFGTIDFLTWLDLEALPKRAIAKFFA
jgi:putative hemolysin